MDRDGGGQVTYSCATGNRGSAGAFSAYRAQPWIFEGPTARGVAAPASEPDRQRIQVIHGGRRQVAGGAARHIALPSGALRLRGAGR